MPTIDTTGRIPIKSWCRGVQPGALKQAVNLTQLPVVFHHVALMPDCHEGFGMPIGGVIGCEDAVIPNAVGVDIGCGMCAVKTNLSVASLDKDAVARILRLAQRSIPVGFNHHPDKQSWKGFGQAPDIPVIQQELNSAMRQLGTLGGGNHFVEIQKGNDGCVWFMIHSGSRNFGLKIANAYHKKALAFCEKRGSVIPDKDLAYLPLDHPDAREYLQAMNYALSFAYENRQRMKDRVKEACREVCGSDFDKEINIHHNFAAQERHFGRDLIVHRKGATRAALGLEGIIPGSMGTASYIVMGKGNPESFESSSHGAGRIMGRNEANRRLAVEDVREAMKGIVYDGLSGGKRRKIDLSEAPQAYKDIDEVMEAQRDLVEVVTRLEPLGVVKG